MTSWPEVPATEVPWLNVAEMRSIDGLAVGELGIGLERMMENAGRSLAVLARHLLGGSVAGRSVTVLAGSGGNGGGGLAGARHLLGAGADVRVLLAGPPERLAPATRDQLRILESLQADVRIGASSSSASDLVVDALLGYSQAGAPRGNVAALIAGAAGAPVLSLDVPSGLELSSGRLHSPHVRALATLTLAAPKAGLRSAGAASPVGELFLADIAVPGAAFSRIGRGHASPFARGPLVRVVWEHESAPRRAASNRRSVPVERRRMREQAEGA